MLNPVFDQFVKKSPISVMARGMMKRVLNPQQLDRWFETNADQRPLHNLPKNGSASVIFNEADYFHAYPDTAHNSFLVHPTKAYFVW